MGEVPQHYEGPREQVSLEGAFGKLQERSATTVEATRLFGKEIMAALKASKNLDDNPELRAQIETQVLPKVDSPEALKAFIDFFFEIRHVDGVEAQIIVGYIDKIMEAHPEKFEALMGEINHGTGEGTRVLRTLIAERNPLLRYVISRS